MLWLRNDVLLDRDDIIRCVHAVVQSQLSIYF